MLDENTKTELEKRIHRTACAQRAFGGADGELVLVEIKNFCRGDGLLIDEKNPDPYLVLARAGKRDVWQFIQNMLKDNPEEARKLLDVRKETA
jgi:hypothetical protein